jgi:hypothetical protein
MIDEHSSGLVVAGVALSVLMAIHGFVRFQNPPPLDLQMSAMTSPLVPIWIVGTLGLAALAAVGR